MSYQVDDVRLADRLKVLAPFGVGQCKPRHFRDMLAVAWKNRDNLGYAWKVLTRGVCDGCALGVAGLHDWTIPGTHLCMTRLNLLRLNTMPPFGPATLADVAALKGRDNSQLRELGRLAWPMLRRHGEAGFTRITWDEAYARIAERIRRSSPDRLAFFTTSRGITNEVYYVAQKVARFLGTNNIDNAARLCHSPSTAAMKRAVGAAATTCSYTDLIGTDLVVFFGANPANDQPVTMKYLDAAKKQGTQIALVNPYLEPGMKRYWVPSAPRSALFGTKITDHWFPVTKGGDIAFLYGTLKALIEIGGLNHDFIAQHTRGFDELRTKAESLAWDELEGQAGLARDAMRDFAELLARSPRAVFVWSMGITQHRHGGDAVTMIVNLGLARGYVGRDQCGLMPIRGHSGVQGGAEMGAYATAFPGGAPINAHNARRLTEQYGFDVPDAPGLTATEMVEAARRDRLDLLYCAGGNFLRTLPEPEYVADAMARVPLRVHQDIILTDQMLIEPTHEEGEVILLPARTRYEQEGGGTQTSTERRVMFSPEIPRQVGEARSEWRIYRDLAHAVDPDRAARLGCETAEAIRQEIARVVPLYDGIQRLKRTGDAFQYGGRHLGAEGRFDTPDGHARFHPPDLPATEPRPDGVFEVATRRGKQFNTLIYAEVDPINNAPRDAILINPDDAARLHLAQGDRATLVNAHGRFPGRIHLAPIAPGNIQLHWPEANHLIPTGPVDEAAGVPDYNTRAWIEGKTESF